MTSLETRRKAVNLYSVIVRVKHIPAKQVECLGKVHHLPAELQTWRLPVGQNPFAHNGLHTYKTSNPQEMADLMRAYKNQEWV